TSYRRTPRTRSAGHSQRSCDRAERAGARPDHSGRAPRGRSELVFLGNQQLHGHLALLGVRRPLLSDGAETDQVDPRKLDALLDKETANRFYATLAQPDVVRVRPDRVRVSLEIHRQVRILLHLLDDGGQRGLRIVIQVPFVKPEQDLVGFYLVAHVAVRPQPRQPAARLVGLAVGALRPILRAFGRLRRLGERTFRALQPGVDALHPLIDALGLVADLPVDPGEP